MPLDRNTPTELRILLLDDFLTILEWPGRVDGSVKPYRCMGCKRPRKGYTQIIAVGEYEDVHSSEGDPEY